MLVYSCHKELKYMQLYSCVLFYVGTQWEVETLMGMQNLTG